MDKIKKYLIRGISIIMVAIALVVSPASDYLDTQGIGETHASAAATAVTLGALIGFAGLAYGVYVDNVHQSTLGDEFGAWVESKGLVDVIPITTAIKNGVTEIVFNQVLINAIKDFFVIEKGLALDSGSESFSYNIGAGFYNTLHDSEYNSQFYDFIDSKYSGRACAVVAWAESDKYLSGFYKPYGFYKSGDNYSFNEVASLTERYEDVVQVLNVFFEYDSKYWFYEVGFDSVGKYVTYTNYLEKTVNYGSDNGVDWSIPGLNYWNTNYISSTVEFYTRLPFYKLGSAPSFNTDLTIDSLYDIIIAESSNKINTATSYGAYDQANLDRLLSATVTGTQITTVNNDLLPQIQNEQEIGSSAQTIADCMSFLFADALIKNAIGENTGTGDDTTDTPTEGVTVGEQAIIDQSVANATGIKGAIQSATQAITDFFTAPLQGIKTVLDNIYSTLTGVVSGVVEGVKTGVKAILTELFVPDTAELEEAVYSMTEKFSFADSLLTLAEDIGNKISGANSPPVIYIDFSESEDERYQSIGKMVAVDFAWYETYKPYGDMILSAVLWCFFILRLLRGAPSILQGMSGGTEVPDSNYQPFGNYIPPDHRIDMK